MVNGMQDVSLDYHSSALAFEAVKVRRNVWSLWSVVSLDKKCNNSHSPSLAYLRSRRPLNGEIKNLVVSAVKQ